VRHVAVDIVTGFLGSGKTTLLRHVLEHGLKGKPVALVMNEIGEVGIDGQVVTGLNYVEKMVELSSGCICCSIDEYRFDLAIQEIIETVHPHLIIIESTGLADPEPLTYRVKAAGLNLDAVITVVDAGNVERFLEETEIATAQIGAADFLVVNKIDLVGADGLGRVERRLRKLNPRAVQFRSVRGAIDSEVLFATGVASYRDRAREPRAASDHLHRDAFGSFLYRSTVELDQPAFERVLERLPDDVIRAKGIVRLLGRDWHCLFNVTCGRTELGWLKLPGDHTENQAVFIGRNLDRHRAGILEALRRCERHPEHRQGESR
jgi:cobalamin biosynthesis protein CobW